MAKDNYYYRGRRALQKQDKKTKKQSYVCLQPDKILRLLMLGEIGRNLYSWTSFSLSKLLFLAIM